jgi:hypothetical protein
MRTIMSSNVTWKVAAGVAIALLAGILLLGSRGGRYARRQAGPESSEVQGALEIVRAVVADPQGADVHVADDASTPARSAVSAAAVRLSKAADLDYQTANWYGDYLRLSVSARTPDGRHVEERFFFIRDGGRLLITGVDQ